VNPPNFFFFAFSFFRAFVISLQNGLSQMKLADAKIEQLKAAFSGLEFSEFRGDVRMVAPREGMFEVLEFLKERQGFDFLVDISCVDYLNYRGAKDRFGLAYLLADTETNERLTVRVYLNEPDLNVPTVTPLWEGANWLEREVYDMFGILFDGHPDHRRILMPEAFTSFPLRKDYPLRGRGERHNFPIITRETS
jgi:NADH-quinone oxidoreductase subunit C